MRKKKHPVWTREGTFHRKESTRAPDVTDGVQRIVSEWKASQESLAPVRSRLGWRRERGDLPAVTAWKSKPIESPGLQFVPTNAKPLFTLWLSCSSHGGWGTENEQAPAFSAGQQINNVKC